VVLIRSAEIPSGRSWPRTGSRAISTSLVIVLYRNPQLIGIPSVAMSHGSQVSMKGWAVQPLGERASGETASLAAPISAQPPSHFTHKESRPPYASAAKYAPSPGGHAGNSKPSGRSLTFFGITDRRFEAS
jgi:hypothetical protein